MITTRSFLSLGAVALMVCSLGAPARADGMSAKAFMKKVNTNADKTISMDELDAYAKKRFAELETDNDKTLDQKELKGRLSEAGMTMADTDKDKSVDEAEFVTYANTLFSEANVNKKAGEASHPTLSEAELATPAGQKLITMLR